MTKTIEEAAKKAIIDNDFFMADPKHPDFVDRGLEQMRACKWVINHIFSLPLVQRLTAEEKERVRKMYAECELLEMDDSPNLPADRLTEARAKVQVLESIFGKEFFHRQKERAMKKLHIEFDAIVTDKSAEELLSLPDVVLTDNIQNGLEIFDECEFVENLKITEK